MKGDTFRPLGGGALAAPPVDDAAHAHCFADEVVIDFPSVARAVEKMRRPFVETERGLPLHAQVSLSARQAFAGATVPLEVPVRSTCRACGGRGETWSEACVPCHGSGTELVRHHVHVTVPAGVEHGARFRFSLATRHDPPTRIELSVAVDSTA